MLSFWLVLEDSVFFFFFFFFLIFFFFQAEDGIRDVAVTGVQTCALPICCNCCYSSRGGRWCCLFFFVLALRTVLLLVVVLTALVCVGCGVDRSEERRVGKECRSGGWRYH